MTDLYESINLSLNIYAQFESICKIERAALNNRIIQDNNFKEMDVLKRDKYKFPPNINEENNDVEQYLITEENWRGLNPHKQKESSLDISKRKRGKYLTAYPDISLIHNRPLRKKKNASIQNGSLLPPIKINITKI